jgi:hypothetical protein
MSALPCAARGDGGAAVEVKDTFTGAEGFQDSSVTAVQLKKWGKLRLSTIWIGRLDEVCLMNEVR